MHGLKSIHYSVLLPLLPCWVRTCNCQLSIGCNGLWIYFISIFKWTKAPSEFDKKHDQNVLVIAMFEYLELFASFSTCNKIELLISAYCNPNLLELCISLGFQFGTYPMRDPFSCALCMVSNKSISSGSSWRLKFSATPPVKSSIASVVNPPSNAS